MSTIREDFFAAKAKGSLWDVAVSIKRGNPLPLDADSIFESYAALEAYAADVLAYPGQVVAVVNEDSTGIYYLDQNLAIKPVGIIPAGDDMSVDMDNNDIISLHNFGKVFYKYVAEDGDVAAHYEKVNVSDENPWAAGLEPKVVTENGKLVLGWYEPNPTTIDGVNDQVTAVQGTVTDLADSLGAPSTENSEATGLYKEVEDVQEEVEELIDTVGSSNDALGENVQTIWAHVNDHTERIAELENIDHSVYALAADLEVEAGRAAAAEKANADAIKVIADDYVKSADIAGMALKSDVEAEATARIDADKALQAQIDLIMDNPDTKDVIDSINEFMTYIDEHGEIAEGFRSGIETNAQAIVDEVARAKEAEGVLAGRLDVLEAIDHDAYIDADVTLKAELEVEIEKKANADQVAEDIAAAKNAAAADATAKADAAKEAAIADADAKLVNKANAADVYAKSETYSQAEVNALLDGIQAGSSESAASVNTKLEALKKTLNAEVYGNEEGTGDSRIDTVEVKLAGIEPGAQVNVIEAVEAAGGAKIIVTKSGKTVTIDDSALQTLIGAARTLAQTGVDAANAVDAKAVQNAANITAHGGRLDTLEILVSGDDEVNGLVKDVAALQAHDTAHSAEFEALSKVVGENSTAIINLGTEKANASDLRAAIADIAQHTTDIAAINEDLVKKANASDLGKYHTKDEITAIIGNVTEDKTLVEMIEDARVAATYDDTAVKKLISDEIARAEEAEADLAGEISRLDTAISAIIDDEDGTTLNSIKDLATWVSEHESEVLPTIQANADAIAAINDVDKGIAAVAKKYTDDAIAGLPAATAEALGLVKFDNVTVKMNSKQQLYVAQVSTDILVQGENELVLNGGTAVN